MSTPFGNEVARLLAEAEATMERQPLILSAATALHDRLLECAATARAIGLLDRSEELRRAGDHLWALIQGEISPGSSGR